MYKILQNGQVMRQEKTDSYEQWVPFGMEIEIRITETETAQIYQQVKFSLISETWEADLTNDTTIVIDGVEHILVDGQVTIPKTPEPELNPTLEEMQIQTLLNTEYLVIMSELTSL